MGVPTFFRWIIEKYPKVIADFLEKRMSVINGTGIPVNTLDPNPNGVEYDNLYIDMNGLIHPCSHPEDGGTAPPTEADMYVNVTKYIDRLMTAVRPRRLLFLAIDGVAPRAKMNQQRSRRFRAAEEAREKQKVMADVLEEMRALGVEGTDGEEAGGKAWDSNVITPGTEFMSRLSTYLWFYILDKVNTNPAWRNVKVVFSDASEPGEGEHKIMKFIRAQRSQPGYDPNQRHILHGLDADLIMLALATHEMHFTILRELVVFGRAGQSRPEKSDGQKLLDAQSAREGFAASTLHPHDEWIYAKPLQALNISVLREYLRGEFISLQYVVPFGFDFERVVDDFVFMCFFVGNDFLPHLPSLDIRDGALDYIIEVYKDVLPSLGNYLTSPGGNVNLGQVDVILARVGEVEDAVFRRKKEAEDREDRRRSQGAMVPNARKFGAARAQQEGDALKNAKFVADSITPLLGNFQEVRKRNESGGTSAKSAISTAISSTPAVSKEGNYAAAESLRGLLGKRSSASSSSTSEATFQEAVNETKVVAGDNVVLHETRSVSVLQEACDRPSKIARKDGATSIVDVKTSESIVADEDELNDEYVPAVEEEAEWDPDSVETVVEPMLSVVRVKASSAVDIEKVKAQVTARLKQKESEIIDKNKEKIVDEVKLHEAGWKHRYYEGKYKKDDVRIGGGLRRMCQTYIEGLCWVFKYYYCGCPSWNWFFPFHYAPFASDLRNIESYRIQFELAEPFRPVEQLLAVLPKESVHALPESCRWLMTSKESPIADLYQGDVDLDPNGKHLPWLWILLLPFIEEKRIADAFTFCKDRMCLEDRRRNAFGRPMIFMNKEHALAQGLEGKIRYLPASETDAEVLKAIKEKDERGSREVSDGSSGAEVLFFDAVIGGGICGTVSAPAPQYFAALSANIPAPREPEGAFRDVRHNNVTCYTYEMPREAFHSSSLLPGAIPDKPLLHNYDLQPRRPPRLNKGRFNIVDMAQNFRRPTQPNMQSGQQYGQQNRNMGGPMHGQQYPQMPGMAYPFQYQMQPQYQQYHQPQQLPQGQGQVRPGMNYGYNQAQPPPPPPRPFSHAQASRGPPPRPQPTAPPPVPAHLSQFYPQNLPPPHAAIPTGMLGVAPQGLPSMQSMREQLAKTLMQQGRLQQQQQQQQQQNGRR